jgi:aspartokinase-like uncharacterized kinase
MTPPWQARSRSVLKFGGSLLAGPEDPRPILKAALSYVQNRSPLACQTIVIIGGGEPVDQLRQQYQTGSISDEQAHWQAIDIIDQHAARYSNSVDGATLLSCLAELDHAQARVLFLQVGPDLRASSGTHLPIGWDVTSDSIAAWIAWQIRAQCLVLAKSVGNHGEFDPRAACEKGWIDRHFPIIAERLDEIGCSLDWFNARAEVDRAE